MTQSRPSALRHAPFRAGVNDSTVPGPVLRDLGNGTGDRDKTQVPRGHREGDRGPRAALIATTTARGRYYDAGAVRRSVGGKVAGDTNMAGVLRGGHTACID